MIFFYYPEIFQDNSTSLLPYTLQESKKRNQCDWAPSLNDFFEVFENYGVQIPPLVPSNPYMPDQIDSHLQQASKYYSTQVVSGFGNTFLFITLPSSQRSNYPKNIQKRKRISSSYSQFCLHPPRSWPFCETQVFFYFWTICLIYSKFLNN